MATYKGTIISNGLAESKVNHTPSIRLQIKADFDLENNCGVDKTFYADLWLSEKAKDNSVKTLRAIGYEGNSIAELNTPCLVGFEVEVSTFMDEYDGKEREKVNFVNAVGTFAKRGIKPIEEAKARSLASRYDALFRNNKATAKPSIRKTAAAPNNTESAAPSAPNYGNGAGDEDLPF